MVVDLQLPMPPAYITSEAVSSNPVHGEVYSIQHYVIRFVSDLGQVGGFLWFPPTIKLTTMILYVIQLLYRVYNVTFTA